MGTRLVSQAKEKTVNESNFKTVVDVNMWISLFEELRMLPAAYHRDALVIKANRQARTENLRVMSEVAEGRWGQVIATQHVWEMLQAKLREPRFGASEQEVQYFLEFFYQIIRATGGTITVRKRELNLAELNSFQKMLYLPDLEDTILVVSAFNVGATTVLTHDNHLASCAFRLDEFNQSTAPTAPKPEIIWKDVYTRQQRMANGEFLRMRRIRFHQNAYAQIVVDHRDRREFLAQPKHVQTRLKAEWARRPENVL